MKSLLDIARDNRAGAATGVAAFRTANAEILRTIFRPILIDASAGAVNLAGGYAGMTPSGFRNFLDIVAAGEGVDPARIVLGGSRLGPALWRDEPASIAMGRTVQLVEACVEGGYDKLHVDTSIPCVDDGTLSIEARIARATILCQAAERAAAGRPLLYTISITNAAPAGTTTPADVHRLFELTERAFTAASIRPALERIVSVAVDFGGFSTSPDFPGLAALAGTIFEVPYAVLEAASADYQDEAILRALLGSRVAILGIGPELGAAFRQAVVAMSHIEAWLGGRPSGVLTLLETELTGGGGDAPAPGLFALDDPARRHWAGPRLAAAVQRLFANIDAAAAPPGLLAQYVPHLRQAGTGRLSLSQRIVDSCVGPVVEKQRRATLT